MGHERPIATANNDSFSELNGESVRSNDNDCTRVVHFIDNTVVASPAKSQTDRGFN
jgi:hypothetical protein